MLEVGWTEILVIAIVLIIVVGPKDLPQMLRTFGRMVSKLRGMAGEFRQQFDEALREADLDDVRKTIGDAQKLNPMNAIREAVNPLRQMGDEIKSDLQNATNVNAASSTVAGTSTDESGTAGANDAAPVPVTATAPVAAAPAAVASPLAAAPVAPVQAAPIEPVRSAGDAGQQGGDASSAQAKPVVKAAAAKAAAKSTTAKTAKAPASKPAAPKAAAAKAPKAASAKAQSAKPEAAKAKPASKASGQPAATTTTRKPKKDKA